MSSLAMRATEQATPDVDAARVTSAVQTARRVASVDAYRGFVMVLMLAEVLRTCAVSLALPSSALWRWVCSEQTHVPWTGASLHDLIQPSFYFLVGIGLLFSLNHRRAGQQSRSAIVLHVAVRSIAFIALGMALVSVHPRRWTWYFADTLTQIGFAYPFLFAIARLPRRLWKVSFAGILIAYWLWFALFPITTAHVGAMTGFAAHWQKNANAAWAFDRWFLNLFPSDTEYIGAESGLTTLNFIPSIATMILGLFAGDIVRSDRTPKRKIVRLGGVGIGMLAIGWTLGALGVVPVVKAIWTPSWVLYSGGWCFLILASFCAVEFAGPAALMYPLCVVGANSLIAYVLSHVYPAFAFNSIARIVGAPVFDALGAAYQPILYGSAIMLAYWLVLFGLYRARIFVRI